MPPLDGRRRDRRGTHSLRVMTKIMTNAFAGENVSSCTVRDIARLACVSTATVSRVVNGAENVSCETRTKVLSTISRLQYCPNAHAAELARANGGIPRKRGINVPTLARTAPKVLSDPSADAQIKRRHAERLRLLEDENSRLRLLVNNLIRELEMW
jgi:hypothetical protein